MFHDSIYLYVACVLVPLSCPTLCDPIGCIPPGSSVHGDSPGKNTGVGCHALLQGIFLTQGSNSQLRHCRWILNRVSQEKATPATESRSPWVERRNGTDHKRVLLELGWAWNFLN